MRLVFPNPHSQANLVLLKAVKNANPFLKVDEPLYIYKAKGEYSEEILKIYNKN